MTDIYNDSTQDVQRSGPILIDLDDDDMTFYRLRQIIEKDIAFAIANGELDIGVYLIENKPQSISKLKALVQYLNELPNKAEGRIKYINILFRGLPNQEILSILKDSTCGRVLDLATKSAIVTPKQLLTENKNNPPFQII